MLTERSSGLLLHPTSLPGPYGIGDLGPAADAWIAWLTGTGCRYWQLLPTGPTGYGDSPYQSFSAFAGNPYLVSPDLLAAEGLLDGDDLAAVPRFPVRRVDFAAVIPWKLGILDTAFERLTSASRSIRTAFTRFREEEARWLDDYALFMAIKEAHGGGSWTEWPLELRRREPSAMEAARDRLTGEAARHAFRQFLFFRQWKRMRDVASAAGVQIIGDIPVYVAPDSADVWSNPDLFLLDEDRLPTHVAGVPPDYFSETGQFWGNPLYDWDRHAETDFAWWIDRLATLRSMVDLLRIDHFRAFADYWKIPAGSETAEFGRWVDGPGKPFFDAAERALGGLPIIAEDLGELHDVVPALRDAVGLPGMKVLQFAYDGDPQNPFLPEHYPEQCVVYTGTHDNQTAAGFYATAEPEELALIDAALGSTASTVAWDMIREAWHSRAVLSIAPVQDVLGLGDEARMNVPSVVGGNWTWRLEARSLTEMRARRLATLNRGTGRG